MRQHVSRKLENEVATFLGDAVVEVVTDVSRETPIKTGQAQSNWLTAIGRKFSYYIANEGMNNAWYDSVDWANRVVRTVRYNDVIHITNNVPYIVLLNRGSSTQAPALFVEMAVLRASYRLRSFNVDLS